MNSMMSAPTARRPRPDPPAPGEPRARPVAPAGAAPFRVPVSTPVAVAVRTGGDVHDLLVDAARTSRRALGADHATILLADAEGALVPAVSVGRDDDVVMPSRFRATPPWRFDPIPSRAVFVNDASASAILPEGWRNALGIRSAAVVPLVIDGVLLGALVVGYATPRDVSDADAALLASAAAPLCYLLGVVGVVEGAQRRQALLDLAAAAGRDLCAARTRHEVLQIGMEAVLAVLGGTSCSVNVVAADGTVDTLASRGRRQPEPGRHAVLDGALPGAVVPMGDDDGARAFLLVGRDGRPPEAADLDLARALAAQTWQAYERAAESASLARRVEFLETIYALAGDTLLDADMEQVLQRLAPAVRSATGAELIDAFLCDATAARLLGASTPNRALAAVVRRWRRASDPRPAPSNDLLAVPLVVEGHVFGVLRVRPGTAFGVAEEQLVRAVADGVGSLVSRVLLRRAFSANERSLAIAEERERVGLDLHDSLGRQLFTLRVELDSIASTVSDRTAGARLREAAGAVSRANADLRLAMHALSFLEHARRGLVPSLRLLLRKIADTTDIDFQLRVTGTPVPLHHGCEEALFRVAHEALANIVRHSRASTATLTVSFSAERTSVIVRDDGTGMSARSDEQRGLHFGLRTMQRRMEEIGGGLDVSNFRPHGVCLHAWVPTT